MIGVGVHGMALHCLTLGMASRRSACVRGTGVGRNTVPIFTSWRGTHDLAFKAAAHDTEGWGV